MSPHTNYEEWHQQGLANLRKLRMKFVQYCNNESDDNEDDENLAVTRKRKVPPRSVVDHCPPTQAAALSNHQSDASSSDNQMHEDDDDDISSSLGELANPFSAAPRKTFGGRKTTTTTAPSFFFTVQPGQQFVGLLEGLVPVNHSYTVKDYMRQVLWEGDFDKAPKTVRLAESHSSLAAGRWAVSVADNAMQQLFISENAPSFTLRHTVRGNHLPARLSTKDVPNLVCWDQQQLFGKAFKATNFCVGSLSLIAFDGFDFLSDMNDIEKAVVETWTKHSCNDQGKRTPVLRPLRINDGTIGVSLLCVLSPEGGMYQVRLSTDDKDHEVIGIDVIFDATPLPTATNALTPSKLREEDKIDVLDKWRGQLSQQIDDNSTGHFLYDDDDDEGIPDVASTKKTLGDLAAELTQHLEASGWKECYAPSNSSSGNCRARDNGSSGKEELEAAVAGGTMGRVDVPIHTSTLGPNVTRSVFQTAKKPDAENTTAVFPLVTPYCNDEELKNDDEGQDSELACIADGRRQLGDEFESMSARILNEVPSRIDFEVPVQHEHFDDQSHGSHKAENEGETVFFDADGEPLSTTLAVDSYEGTEFHDGKHQSSITVFSHWHDAMSDVFFGCHDAAGVTEMEGTEVGGSFVDEEEPGYETWLGYVWYQWFLPMVIMAAVTGPAAHYAIECCREMEILQEPETVTWTEWFWSWV
eukprot:scaffold2204_cov166-Amphora_coffeaeformis.AAC.28